MTDDIARRNRELQKKLDILSGIGTALLAEKNTGRLLDLILVNARQITQADSGSIYIVNRGDTGWHEHHDERTAPASRLRFMLTQNDTISPSFKEHLLNIDKNSIAGYVALTQDVLNIDDVYNLPPGSPYDFNKEIDSNTGYYTKSMLVVPMSNQKREIIGVLQLINKKKDSSIRLNSRDTTIKEVISFEKRDIHLLSSLAGQAAVSLENSLLYQEIHRLFKGFVKASATAIEARDPTTSGHSERVAALTICLANKVSKKNDGTYASLSFNADEILEIEYAAILHDFGKVGVREHVLVKSHKLSEKKMDVIKERFLLIKRTVQVNSYKRRVECLLEKGREKFFAVKDDYDKDLEGTLKEIDEQFRIIGEANRPIVLQKEVEQQIFAIADRVFENLDGEKEPFLTQEEVKALTIPRGSLTEAERFDIESHVTHTYNFLRTIPWIKKMEHIPGFAYLHHEQLDGGGYPRRIKAVDIPVQSRMIAIADIYDALTAEDRPYKKSVPHKKAIDILIQQAKEEKIDKDLLDIFIEERVFEVIM